MIVLPEGVEWLDSEVQARWPVVWALQPHRIMVYALPVGLALWAIAGLTIVSPRSGMFPRQVAALGTIATGVAFLWQLRRIRPLQAAGLNLSLPSVPAKLALGLSGTVWIGLFLTALCARLASDRVLATISPVHLEDAAAILDPDRPADSEVIAPESLAEAIETYTRPLSLEDRSGVEQVLSTRGTWVRFYDSDYGALAKTASDNVRALAAQQRGLGVKGLRGWLVAGLIPAIVVLLAPIGRYAAAGSFVIYVMLFGLFAGDGLTTVPAWVWLASFAAIPWFSVVLDLLLPLDREKRELGLIAVGVAHLLLPFSTVLGVLAVGSLGHAELDGQLLFYGSVMNSAVGGFMDNELFSGAVGTIALLVAVTSPPVVTLWTGRRIRRRLVFADHEVTGG